MDNACYCQLCDSHDINPEAIDVLPPEKLISVLEGIYQAHRREYDMAAMTAAERKFFDDKAKRA